MAAGLLNALTVNCLAGRLNRLDQSNGAAGARPATKLPRPTWPEINPFCSSIS
jgi:hypothetical protein